PEQGWRVCSGRGQRGDALRAGPPISRLVAGTRLVVNVSDDEVKDGRIERSDATGLTVTSSGAWPYDVRSRSRSLSSCRLPGGTRCGSALPTGLDCPHRSRGRTIPWVPSSRCPCEDRRA